MLDSPTVQWWALQISLEQAKSDVLILLDCCAAASSVAGSGSGITEVIAACGSETSAPGVGENSFSRRLIEEISYLKSSSPFSAALLHDKVLTRIKYENPSYNTTHEQRRTPVHILVASKADQRSIELAPLQPEFPIDMPVSAEPPPSGSSVPSSNLIENVDTNIFKK